MSPKTIKNIAYAIKGGLFILPILSLIVVDFLFFPFITGKNFFFRIVVEILFFLWVFVMVFDKKYRPKKSLILLSFVLLISILTLATIFGENPYRSFWSNYERMEGLIGHLHLFTYFLILTSVFHSKKDWKIFFSVLIGVSFIVTIYGFLQYFGKAAIHQGDTRLDASLGNATYLAIFLIFHLFLIALFFYWYRYLWLRIVLGVIFALEMLVVFLTATRGAILGLLGGLFLFGILMAIFGRHKKLRYIFGGLVIGLLLFVGLFILIKDTQFVKDNYVLTRFSSFSGGTVESRFTIWGMSWKGFQEHPILGWGPENYNLVFNKYFESSMYAQEPWFDRSHNVMFDWLITTGIFGLLAYLSLFGSALYMLWKGYKKKYFSLFESAACTSLFAAYGFHNLFVFDNLTSYFVFFSILGYIHFVWISNKKQESESKTLPKDIGVPGYLAITLSFVFVIFVLLVITVKPLRACNNLLEALYLMRRTENPEIVLGKFNDVFKLNTFGSGEAREQLTSYANNIISNKNISDENKTKVVVKAIEEMEKQVESNSDDIRYLLMLSAVYNGAGMKQEALEAINKAVELSPKKQQLYFVKADIHRTMGQLDKAIETMRVAYELEINYMQAVKNLAIVYVVGGREQEAEELLMKHYSNPIIADARLATAYFNNDNYEKVRDIWLEFVKGDPDNAQHHFSLAAAYLKLGEKEKAIAEIQKVIDLRPDFKEQGEQLINDILSGKDF